MTSYAQARALIAKNLPIRTDAVATAKADSLFRRYDIESWLISRLGAHGVDIEDGASDYDTRRERIRERIQAAGLRNVQIGLRAGVAETYAQFFERFYNQPLGTPCTQS